MQRKKNELTDFGFWVKMRLLERRITQVELAQQLGTNKQVVSRILYGGIPGRKHKKKIVAILGGGYPAENNLKAAAND